MKTHSVCLPILVTLALSVAVARANMENIPRGVSPSSASLYVPDKANNWSCLDGSKTIPFSAVNDDYCDCSDGSDEPGTSACGTGNYYCSNIGHTPSSIKTSRVNDGVCDEECCDGSDEYDGQTHCPNVCDEVGAKAREEYGRVQSIQNVGARLRRGFIKYGKANKISLNKELETLRGQIDEVKEALADAKDKLDVANAAQDAYLEGNKNEREAARKLQLEPIIQDQTKRLNYAVEIRDMLKHTLQNLKENHNKNYHDLAVKDTVSGFNEYIVAQSEDKAETAQEEAIISSDRQIDGLMDETSLVLRDIGTLYDLLEGMKRDYNTEYNDEAVLAAIKVADDFEVTWDSSKQDFVDVEPIILPEEQPVDNPEAEKIKETTDLAQNAYNDAAEKESKVQDGIQDIERKLSMDLGHDETFAQFVDNCFDYKDTEYTYSICLFGDANQRSHSSTHLGKFSGWEGDNYDMQMYTGGAKCWNGPERSVKLVMTCGTTTEIISVTEPEKCEYLFKLQTPAVCPVSEGEGEGEGQEQEQEQKQEVKEEDNEEDKEHSRKHDEL
ncbi:MAG: glucosidase II beta subunit-like-domain-containing protein [Linnemannia gamsii]|nr:MAG: glucosidase II beta subunit-like-domain-containing protein [Linnemannia gamsii]